MSSDTKMKKMYVRTHVINLMRMSAKDLGIPGIAIGFALAEDYLNLIAERAMELEDKKLIAYLYQLGLLETDDEEEKEEIQRTLEEDSENE